jgi:hypothetical protein
MGIPDFLNNNNDNAGSRNHYDDSSRDRNKSYIENLVRVFAANPSIEKAYFGLLYNEEKEDNDLFLAVEHMGAEAEEIQAMTDIVRQTFLPDREMFFTSTVFQPELFGFIANSNFPFYTKNKPQLLNMAIMNQWFDPVKYKKDFIFQVKTGILTSLFKDFDPLSNILNFQTFIRDGKEFIPLFSDRQMIFKSGMTQVPSDLTAMEFDWMRIQEAVEGGFRQHFYVLNPGTSFEVEFNA